jgi:SAM-dependent methyltransferase
VTELQREVKEGATGLLPLGQVHHPQERLIVTDDVEPGDAVGPLYPVDARFEELSPLSHPASGVFRRERASDGDLHANHHPAPGPAWAGSGGAGRSGRPLPPPPGTCEAGRVEPEFTDRRRLVADAYADDKNLAARQRLWSYRTGPGFHERLIDLVDWSDVATLLDVGCGNAIYLDRLLGRLPNSAAIVGLDLSWGMLAAARHPNGRVVGDIEMLPVRSASVDATLALHMLYHAPRPERAVAELRRVTRRGGVVVVSTNGARHFSELAGLVGQRRRASSAVGLDRAEKLLAPMFTTMERHDFLDEFVVPDAEPVMSYLRSMVSLGYDAASLAEADRRVREVISCEGSLRITAAPGVLICR